MSPALLITDLVLAYGGVTAVKGISLDVPAGRTVCLIGANGAGKTSVMRAISGLVKAKTGSISYFGEELTGSHPAGMAARGIAHVPEGRETFQRLTVEESLRMGGFRLSGVEFARRRDAMYDTFPRLRERRTQVSGLLSGGEQQMLAMARALISSPKLLLLDEPSMGLAPNIVDEVFKVIADLRKTDTTVLLVEQNALRALELADYAYVMETGSIVMEGEGRQLANDPRITTAYLGGEGDYL
ncbi:ABC transporter ATP-binding protein [Xanthobacter sp. KR7-65]|uniref:ABC transporter ATP-binding protein n=1 Tax=Xanthobacter sp. KR7-65 TaxID=3156612 RepID=UPI0032B313D4